VAHGDKTWAKLFPAYFHRQTLVDDLYVADTVQVDVNVTRTLERELRAHDWRLLVLHYLGLDHAGHLAGRDRFVCTRTA
jgi:ethanolaminephosphotransferase